MSREQPELSGQDYRVLGEIGAMHKAIRAELAKRIVGQDEVIEQVLTAFFAGGHVLLLGVPGLAKTLLISTLAEILGMKFNRIQFTPDLMPSDITGSDVLSGDDDDRSFNFMGGPIFANFLLADEINRTPPKTQAALLEAMEEFAVTVAGQRHELPKPYFVMATQNPIEQEGTYILPAAALDRFMFTVLVDYPTQHDEMEMLYQTTSRDMPPVNQLLNAETITRMLDVVRRINMRDETMRYAIQLVRATRPENRFHPEIEDMVECGGSPRATQALILGAKARAALQGRDEALPDDVRAIALPAMHHRILTNFHAEADGVNSRDIVRKLIDEVPRPVWDAQLEGAHRSFSLMDWLSRVVLGKGGKRVAKHGQWGNAVQGGLIARFFAQIVDTMLLAAFAAVLYLMFAAAAGTSFSTDGDLTRFLRLGVAYVLSFLGLSAALLTLFEARGGTPGKLLFGLRVMDDSREAPGVGLALVRLIVWMALAPISGIVALFNSEHRTLSDMATSTTVKRIGPRAERKAAANARMKGATA